MPLRIEITERDIAEAEGALGVTFDDEGRREGISCTGTRDIQACPGSGKTTLLVAKLAILARKWTWRDRGICVLSHTNAARHEVEERLLGYPSAHRLLGYPHYVGTIQVFVDRFLALPCLRNMGVDVHAVDSERFAAAAMKRLPWNIASFLKKNHRLSLASNLTYVGPDLALTAAGKALPWQQGKTFDALVELKQTLTGEGLLRYEDMYAFASRHLAQCPWGIAAIRHRFPWVFIDEMQDTGGVPDDLLASLFSDGCILQRLGDSNQGIFGGSMTESENSFPTPEGHLGLPCSKRFGQQIADYASPLAAVTPQKLVGDPSVPSRQHTVFFFDDDTISLVLPSFGKLLAKEYGSGTPEGFVAKAIGFRKTPPADADPKKTPSSIGRYHPDFDPNLAVGTDRPSRLIGFVRKARHLLASDSECKEASDFFFDGMLEFLHLAKAVDPSGQRFTKTRLVDALTATNEGSLQELRMLVVDLLFSGESVDEVRWQEAVSKLKPLLEPFLTGEPSAAASSFLGWVEGPNPAPRSPGPPFPGRRNVYRHDSSMGPIEIELSTIHGAKGQTHTATLVLETYFQRNHDLKAVLPLLVGRKVKMTDTLRGHMKRLFVAMTRPRELLCLAVHKSHLSADDVDGLSTRGWAICDLTGGGRLGDE